MAGTGLPRWVASMRNWIVVIAVCAGLAGVAAAQEARTTLVVTRPATIGLDQPTADAFADLVRGEIARRPNYAVVATSLTPPEVCGEAACAAMVAQQTQAQLGVAFSMSKLGGKVIIRVTVADQTGRVLLADRVSAANPEDLDPLSVRVATAVATGQAIGDTITVSTVTEEEAKEPRRRKALLTSGIRLGGGMPMAGSFGGAGPFAHIGVFSLYELGAFAPIVEGDVDWTPGSNDVDFARLGLGIGARIFPDKEADTGWYFGAGFGYRFLAVVEGGDSDAESGMGVYAGVGAVFMRTADLHVIADLRYDVDLFELEPRDGNERSHAVMASLGFSYSKGLKGFFR